MESLSVMLLEKLGVLNLFDYLVGGDTFKKINQILILSYKFAKIGNRYK